jgi:hypothetical protein
MGFLDLGQMHRVLEEIAQASEKSHPRQALEVHQCRVIRLVQTGGNQSYEEAHRLIERMRIIAEQSGEANGQAAFESDLLAKHHASGFTLRFRSPTSISKSHFDDADASRTQAAHLRARNRLRSRLRRACRPAPVRHGNG